MLKIIKKICSFTRCKFYLYLDKFNTKIKGINTKKYWDYRFKNNWELRNGRIQTAIFAAKFVLLDKNFNVSSILDYGCGCGDSLPLLKMKYPDAELFFYDLSEEAMKKANQYYGNFAKPILISGCEKFDMVYCSNVIEHISDCKRFCIELIKLSKKYIVIQAPYNERHEDGSLITEDKKIDEHVNTIEKDLIEGLCDYIDWEIILTRVPFAWEKGEQIFFVGKINNQE